MITVDYLSFPRELPKGNETELFATETLLVHTIPSIVKGLLIAFVLHSDRTINEKAELSWEIYGDKKRLGDFGGPLQLNLSANEPYKSAFKLPDFEVPAEGEYMFVMFINNERVKDVNLEIRLPRE